jgi:hypothetical protein
MTAAVMADWIVNSILKEARKLYKSNTSPETRSFAVGAMHKLALRVDEIKRTTAQQFEATPGTALVLASLYDTEAQANNELMPADLKVVKSKQAKVKRDAYEAGVDFGAKINLSAQVADQTKAAAKLK